MQAIRTRYYGPSNVRGSRIKAQCEAGSITVHYDHALDIEGNHVAAREALLNKLNWRPAQGRAYTPMVVGFFGHDGYHVFQEFTP